MRTSCAYARKPPRRTSGQAGFGNGHEQGEKLSMQIWVDLSGFPTSLRMGGGSIRGVGTSGGGIWMDLWESRLWQGTWCEDWEADT
mmetsp:Transcript_73267/g.195292  ORF Transcript_73267/g.195292 Transcript_73267/m.195292 type:complete len:86 (+) Transcript_73267:326-583(+)